MEVGRTESRAIVSAFLEKLRARLTKQFQVRRESGPHSNAFLLSSFSFESFAPRETISHSLIHHVQDRDSDSAPAHPTSSSCPKLLKTIPQHSTSGEEEQRLEEHYGEMDSSCGYCLLL